MWGSFDCSTVELVHWSTHVDCSSSNVFLGCCCLSDVLVCLLCAGHPGTTDHVGHCLKLHNVPFSGAPNAQDREEGNHGIAVWNMGRKVIGFQLEVTRPNGRQFGIRHKNILQQPVLCVYTHS